VRKPVGLARDVVVDPLEPERLEPARGSWAEVSETVVAVPHCESQKSQL
jgi:hypothetical protein